MTGPRYTVLADQMSGFVVIDHVYGGDVIHARFRRGEDAQQYTEWRNSQPDPENRPPISYAESVRPQEPYSQFEDESASLWRRVTMWLWTR